MLFEMSAVAAHHGPPPAFQTIILDRACLGSILKGSRHRVSKNAPFRPSKQAHALSFRGLFSTPIFYFDGYGLTPNLSGNKRIGEIQNQHFYTHATFLAGKWYKSSPPLTPLTPNS